MTAGWMLQASLAAALLGIAALAAERVAGWFGLPRRAAWAAAMGGSLLLAALSVAAPGLLPDAGIFPPAAAATDPGTLPLPGSGAPWRGGLSVLLGPGWLAASLAMLGVVAWTYRRLRKACAGGARVELDGGEVCVTERVGPAVVGLVHPRVVVPRWVLDAPAGERRLVLLHEREHVAAGDAWLLLFGVLAVAAMPWSVPLWWQHRRLRAAVEADCDARVLGRGVSRRDYGQVLIRTAGGTPGLPHFGPAWGDSISQLERRIMTMTAKPPEHRLLRSLPLLALALAVATTACDVAGGAEAELATGPASVRVSVAAELRAGKTSRVTDPPPAPPPPLAPPPSAPPPPAPMEARASSGPPAPPAPSDPPPPPGAGPERTP